MTAPTSSKKVTPRTSNNSQKTAMNQPTTPQVDDRLARIQTSMIDTTNVLKLARFAAEARRTLQGIEDLGRQNPEVASAIGESVEAPREWQVCEDVLGQVLGHTAHQLQTMQDELESAIGAMHRSANTGSAQTGSAS
jgi:hypothetical protein